jgi:tuberous sclerosis protein 2
MAATALINAFSSLAFATDVLANDAEWVFRQLLYVIQGSRCAPSRLVILQFMMRLRSDREHHVYLVGNIDAEVTTLATMLDFTTPELGPTGLPILVEDPAASAQARSRPASRGRTAHASASRSQSRAPPMAIPGPRINGKLPRRWAVPEAVPFFVPDTSDDEDLLFILPSSLILTYMKAPEFTDKGEGSDSLKSDGKAQCLLTSEYVSALAQILEKETDWDVLAYVLIHLPAQLSNKHFFCGPNTKRCMRQFVTALCDTLASSKLGTDLVGKPDKFAPRDIQAIGYHVLNVLISYRDMFPGPLREKIVSIFVNGLESQVATLPVLCVRSLHLASYVLEAEVAKSFAEIVQKLKRIVGGDAEIAVHILNFLKDAAYLRQLYAQFKEEDFASVFEISLNYLKTHHDPEANTGVDHSLTQYVLVSTFNVIYNWFMAVPIEERSKHIKFITMGILEASGNVLSEPGEVCFDWLSRYTYASVDPRPAPSILRDAVMSKPASGDDSPAIEEKWWLAGTSILCIRANSKRGWCEVEVRRASGLTRLLVRVENHPHVPVGDVDPDIVSLAAATIRNRMPMQLRDPARRFEELQAQETDAAKPHLSQVVRGLYSGRDKH